MGKEPPKEVKAWKPGDKIERRGRGRGRRRKVDIIE